MLFRPAERLEEGKGIWLPANGDNAGFHQLLSTILFNTGFSTRKPQPQITLLHPRNAVCTDTIFEEIHKYAFPSRLVFHQISLIEQVNGSAWQTLAVFELNGKTWTL